MHLIGNIEDKQCGQIMDSAMKEIQITEDMEKEIEGIQNVSLW